MPRLATDVLSSLPYRYARHSHAMLSAPEYAKFKIRFSDLRLLTE